MLKTQEHIDLMEEFEKQFKGRRMDLENKEMWPSGVIYQDGDVNALFLAFRRGYALGKAIGRHEVHL